MQGQIEGRDGPEVATWTESQGGSVSAECANPLQMVCHGSRIAQQTPLSLCSASICPDLPDPRPPPPARGGTRALRGMFQGQGKDSLKGMSGRLNAQCCAPHPAMASAGAARRACHTAAAWLFLSDARPLRTVTHLHAASPPNRDARAPAAASVPHCTALGTRLALGSLLLIWRCAVARGLMERWAGPGTEPIVHETPSP